MTQQATKKITILIVDDIPETRENLRKLLYFESDIEIVGMADDGRKAVEQAKKLQPDIVLMDINMPDMDGITASQEISRVAPVSQIIMMSVQSEDVYLRRSMGVGARDFLIKPFTSDELSSSIHRVYEMGAGRRAVAPLLPVTEAGMAVPSAMPGRRPSPAGKLLMVYSPKGGTGCSMVASNLSIALAQVTSKRVALVDASLQFGDTDVLLNLQGNRTFADAADRINELDSDLMNVLMSPHPSGIRVLAAPPTPVAGEAVTLDTFKKVLAQLKRDFDYIVLDTWSYLDDMILTAIDLSDRILVVMTPEIPSIKSTKQFFDIAEALKFPIERLDLVLNKVIPRDGIRAERIENSLKHTILAQFDFDPKSIRQCINQGSPLMMVEPNHPLSQGFLQLAEQEAAILEPQPEAVPEEADSPPLPERGRRTGLFGRLKK
jgi:pilus assembly protein CpaE